MALLSIILGLTICLILLSLVAFVLYIRGNKNYWRFKGVATVPSKELGTFMQRIKLPFHEIDVRAYNAFKSIGPAIPYGGLVELRKPAVLLLDPDLIRQVLVKDFDHFINRRAMNMKDMDPYFHKMLFNMEDQQWKEMRATMSPTFTTGKIKRMFDIFETSSLKLVQFLKNATKSGEGVDNGVDGVESDVRDSFGRFTLDVIAAAAFGVQSGNFDAGGGKATIFTEMSDRIHKSTQFGVGLMIKFIVLMTAPILIKPLGFRLFDQIAMDFFADVVRKTIRQREENEVEKRADFLQLMLDAKNGRLEDDNDTTTAESSSPPQQSPQQSEQQQQKKAKLTGDLILAQCVSFFLAGLDTTESLLMFAVYELGLNQDVQQELFEEVDEAMRNNARKLSYDLVNQMPYLDMVVSETLRKYPPVWRLERRVNMPYKPPNSELVWEKDTLVMIPTYAIHHDENIYPDPQKFLPRRFSPEEKAARHPYTYMPFGLGLRSCIAMRFALVEAKTALAYIVHSFAFEPSAKTPIPIAYTRSTTLKPKGGLWLNVKSRTEQC